MTETFVALLLAHAIADFLLQPGWMARGKQAPGTLAAHGGIVFATAALTFGPQTGALTAIAALTLAHLAVDAVKARIPPSPVAFLGDQAVHLALIATLAILHPGLWAAGWATGPGWLPGVMAIAAFGIIGIVAGGYAVGQLMSSLAIDQPQAALPNGGKIIGWLERALVFGLVIVGQPAGIGFLVAAKSILRFDTAHGSSAAAEYVIIGTLASFAWGLGSAYCAIWTLSVLQFALPFP